MKPLLYLLTGLFLAWGVQVDAADAVKFVFAVSQRDTANHRDVVLYTDTADVVKDIPAVGFMAVVSVEVRVSRIDSNSVSYSVQTVTATQPAATAAREVTSEFGLPLTLANLNGKNGSTYAVSVRPIKRTRPADRDIKVTSASLDKFQFNPTAHTDLYFLKNTHGDFFWNLVKGMFESEYDQFDAMIKFNVPGKYSIYLCPAPIASVIWDERFGQVVDPTRGTAYVVYTTGANSADPFVLMLLAIYRQYGYAPAFLADGLANFGGLGIDEMKELVKAGKARSLAPFLNSHAYFTGDPRVSDITSATFVKYLIFKYSLDRFLTLYNKADDLNLQASIEQVYAKPIADLEKEWLTWIDTVRVKSPEYQYYAERAEAMFDYGGMLRYSHRMEAAAVSRLDSLRALPLLARAYFNSGDYYGATNTQRAYLKTDSSSSAWMAYAGYQMMNGVYDSARVALEHARTRDTSSQLIVMNLGLNRLFAGDTSGAREILTQLASSSAGPAMPEAKVVVGQLCLHSPERAVQARAIPFFQDAVAAFQARASQHEVLPTEQMWLGMAFLGLDDQSNAMAALQLADFIEARPFYRGIIRLWLGKAADLRGERDVARDYYTSVISGASAHYTQQEARRYLQTPYTQ